MTIHFDKLDEFLTKTSDFYTPDPSIFFRALIACLSPSQAVEYFATNFSQPYIIRRIVTSRILKDIQRHFEDCHSTLIDQLIATYPNLSSTSQRSCASMLRMIAEHTPKQLQIAIYQQLLSSPRRIIRDYALRHARDTWDPLLLPLVRQIWDTYGDDSAAWLIAAHETNEEVASIFPELLDSLLERPSLLVISVNQAGSHQTKMLRLIQSRDPITHCYVLTKIGQSVTKTQAVALFRKNRESDRASLLIWCFGQMGLWDAIIECQKLAKNPFKKKY